MSGFTGIQQTREGGLYILVNDSFWYKVRGNLSVSSKGIKCLCIEIKITNSKNVSSNFLKHLPNGDKKEFQNYFKSTFLKRESSGKYIMLAGDFSINVLDFNEIEKFKAS